MAKPRLHLYHGQYYTAENLSRLAKQKYKLDISRRNINRRLHRGWNITKSISTPIDQHHGELPDKFLYQGLWHTRLELYQILETNPRNDDLTAALIAANITHLIKVNKTKKYKLAKYLHVNISYLNRYLRKEKTPNTITLVHLAQFFNVKIDYFINSHFEEWLKNKYI